MKKPITNLATKGTEAANLFATYHIYPKPKSTEYETNISVRANLKQTIMSEGNKVTALDTKVCNIYMTPITTM